MQSVLILGGGITGQALARYFQKKGIKNHLIQDTKNHELIDWTQYDSVVKSPGVPLSDDFVIAAKNKGLPVLSDMDFFENPQQAKIIGVTGTNGKSTVCAMINHMLDLAHIHHALGGNFGVPLTDLPILPSNGVYILELSSYQLELPVHGVYDMGILLNIDEDHQDHHGTMQAYADAKENLLRMSSHKIVVTNDVWTQAISQKYKCTKISNMAHNDYWVKNQDLFQGDQLQTQLPIKTGPHDVLNAAVVWVVGKFLGIEETIILNSLRTYQPLPHRQTMICRIGNVDFINDSKATNIHAVIPSLQRFSGKPIHLILGGVPKFENLDALIPYLNDVQCVYGIGQASTFIEKCLKGIKPFISCQDMPTAVTSIFERLDFQKPATVLLAPACSSFDQYKNYEERGDHFALLVKNRVKAPQLKN